MLTKMEREGQKVWYNVMRKGFFVISSDKDGVKEYLRYHRDGVGLLGFAIYWRSNDAPLYGWRIVTLVSGSLSNEMLGTPMIPVPKFDEAAPLPAPPADQNRAAAPAPNLKVTLSSGSGFFVSNEGYVLTNNHVIDDCTSVRVFKDHTATVNARVMARDVTNDLALLSTTLKPQRAAALRFGVKQGEPVAA
jgi:serine protease Do